MVIIEMNYGLLFGFGLQSDRVPIARVAAKLAVDYTHDELRQRYYRRYYSQQFRADSWQLMTKIPRFTFEKFATTESLRPR